jgi:hypothetical protein
MNKRDILKEILEWRLRHVVMEDSTLIDKILSDAKDSLIID